ncbi:MAG: M1 family metallopeptidase [Clostridia bacterium]|nr:M1 family metallopeptidase [Clostridia bacterium]
MKYLLFLTALLMAVAVIVFFFFHGKGSKETGLRAAKAADGLDHYMYELVFRPESDELAVTLTLQYTNRTQDTQSDIVLRTWAGAYQQYETSPASIDELFDSCYPEGFSEGGISIEGVWWNDTIVSYSFDDEASTVLRVPVGAIAADESGRLRLRCRIQVPHCAHRFGESNGIYQFGNALPVLSVWQDGVWHTDEYWPIGDPFMSECANYDVTLSVPKGWMCAATGSSTSKSSGDRTLFSFHADAVREFGFALSDKWQKAEKKADGITVSAYALSKDGAKKAAEYAVKALRYCASHYGDYPYSTFTVCSIGFPFGGMEYPQLVMVSNSCFEKNSSDTLELTLVHETAHQWFYALVGSDSFNQPWQDETLCEYTVLGYVKERYGTDSFQALRATRVDAAMQDPLPLAVTPGSPISYYSSYTAYSSVVYGRGTAFLLDADEMTGKVDAALKAYCDRYAFRIASRDDLLTTLCDSCEADLYPLAVDYLDTLM